MTERFGAAAEQLINVIFAGHGRDQVVFDEVEFAEGSSVYFRLAEFRGGHVRFDRATFSGGWVTFDSSRFTGGTVDFTRVADFTHAPHFDLHEAPHGLQLPAGTEISDLP